MIELKMNEGLVSSTERFDQLLALSPYRQYISLKSLSITVRREVSVIFLSCEPYDYQDYQTGTRYS